MSCAVCCEGAAGRCGCYPACKWCGNAEAEGLHGLCAGCSRTTEEPSPPAALHPPVRLGACDGGEGGGVVRREPSRRAAIKADLDLSALVEARDESELALVTLREAIDEHLPHYEPAHEAGDYEATVRQTGAELANALEVQKLDREAIGRLQEALDAALGSIEYLRHIARAYQESESALRRRLEGVGQ